MGPIYQSHLKANKKWTACLNMQGEESYRQRERRAAVCGDGQRHAVEPQHARVEREPQFVGQALAVLGLRVAGAQARVGRAAGRGDGQHGQRAALRETVPSARKE